MKEKHWVKKIIGVILVSSLFTLCYQCYVSQPIFLSHAQETTPNLSIINVQSYPLVGGQWSVSFTVEGTSDLIIRAVQGTTWDINHSSHCDLQFQHITDQGEQIPLTWKDGGVYIENFSSTTVIQETSKVLSLGKHVLEFTFGETTVYAYNDANNWWNNSWGYRKKITINSSQVEGILPDFPVLVNISDTDLEQKANLDGTDIAFVSYEDNTSKFPHELEGYSKGNLTAWISLPRISSSTNISFWMYYNNSASSTQENPTAVWDTTYMMVHHLNETDIDGGINDITDSTINYNNGTTINMDSSDQVPGKINGSFDFDGDNDHVEGTLSSNPVTIQFTLSDWITISTLNAQYNHLSLGASGGTRVVPYIDASNNINCYFGNDSDNTILPSDITIDTTNKWYHIVCTYNSTHLAIYVDGDLQNSTPVSHSLTNNDFVIGSDISKLSFFHEGKIDEVRISNISRNNSWIKTSYNTIQNQSQFLSLGNEESSSPVVSNPTPTDNNEFVSKTPSFFEITIFDPNPELLNITWRTNQSGIWETFNVTNGTGNGVTDGTYQVINTSWVTLYDQAYWWSVNVTDGIHWTNVTYSFTMHQFTPTINSILLKNATGNKFENTTGSLTCQKKYDILINISDKNGWEDIHFVNITSWYDHGNDTSLYNETQGGNLNMFLQYENTTGTSVFRMNWPHEEVTFTSLNCSETIINGTTRILNISFTPNQQTRYAISNNTWTNTQNVFDDPYSWNMNCTIEDSLRNKDSIRAEYGVQWNAVITATEHIEINGPPGMTTSSSIMTVTYSINSPYNLSIYLEKNFTQIDGNDIIGIANNLSLLENADPTDELIVNTTFTGVGENHTITLFNTSAPENNIQQNVLVQFELSIPFGTWGSYSSIVTKKIYQVE